MNQEEKLAYREISFKYRGVVLHSMANLELVMGTYLAHFFCSGNKEKMQAMLLYALGDYNTPRN